MRAGANQPPHPITVGKRAVVGRGATETVLPSTPCHQPRSLRVMALLPEPPEQAARVSRAKVSCIVRWRRGEFFAEVEFDFVGSVAACTVAAETIEVAVRNESEADVPVRVSVTDTDVASPYPARRTLRTNVLKGSAAELVPVPAFATAVRLYSRRSSAHFAAAATLVFEDGDGEAFGGLDVPRSQVAPMPMPGGTRFVRVFNEGHEAARFTLVFDLHL